MRLDRNYLYPTREAYRYHFMEPPVAPTRHDEVNRIQSILKSDKPYNRRHWDFKPMTSERTELEHQMAPEVLRKDAPFGNDSTPTITMKIIGGRQVPVIEKHPVYNNDYAGSRIQPLRPIADKPNHLDPRIHGDNPGGYYTKDVQEIFSHPLEHKGFDFERFYNELGDKPTNFVNKRPDSKDVVRGQFKALPPIQQNRTRNDLSTVFEAEPWTGNKNPPLADDTEYKQNYFLGRDFDREMEQHHSHVGKDFYFVSESERKNLFMLLPRNVLLPVDPIKLTREQETNLCKLICNELNRFDPKELREVYIECSQHDKELRGFCGIEILDNSLRRHKAYMPETLRLVAAQFVDPNYPGKVNYEKTLSFIGSALHLNSNGQFALREIDPWSQEKQPKYYMQNGESFKTGSIYRDREVAKLLRLVEQELSKNTYAMDWTRWQNSFYERDRDHRDTLSAAQIKDICYDQKLPLSDSVINQILNLCEDNNRDGQYRWHSFLEFLQRVRPSNTGLPIPVSKRPLEYAKHYPEPVPNWPRTDADTERRGTSPRRDVSPRRGENRRDDSRGQTPVLKVATPRERIEKKPEENRANTPKTAYANQGFSSTNHKSVQFYAPKYKYLMEASSPERCRSRERISPQDRILYHDRPTLPKLRLNSPSPINKSPPPASPRERNKRTRYHHDLNPARDDSDEPFQNFYKNEYDRFTTNEDNYKGWQRDEKDNWRGDKETKWRGYGGDKWADNWNYRDNNMRRMSIAERPSVYEPSWQQNAQQRSVSPPYPRRGPDRDTFRRDERPEDSAYERHWRKWAFKSYREPREIQRLGSRNERPKSYADPPRKTSIPILEGKRRRPFSYREDIRVQDQSFGRPQSRLQTPLRRTQSLSPVRNMSPVRGQPNPYIFRDTYGAQTYREYTSNRQQYPYENMNAYNNRYNDRDRDDYQRDGRNSYRDDYQQRDGRNSYRDGYRQGDGYRYAGGGGGGGRGGEGPPREREQQIMQLSQQLHDLESKYEVTKEAISSRDKPWLDRYLKLAQALYDSDISNKGSLPRKDVMAIVNQYNNAFNLKIDIDRANMLSISPENLDKSGNIILRSFLANLSADRISYKV
ncbi:uncharacterized protein LOC132757872 isoform X6 [Ruditapes philippinarum]|uniref:uncharacterized protein LOC132757872 isoform X6 n=1 Tax=Ruditapes philippinarum TaxID=129788 RepID=UPI00295AAA8A|nr:uncharacterized protein LOC132757872 isoform X6 [Ruditapes philippinarum]